jgi:hypothetical protein
VVPGHQRGERPAANVPGEGDCLEQARANGTNIVWYDSNSSVAGYQAPAKLSINDVRLDSEKIWVDVHAKFYENHFYGDYMKKEKWGNRGTCIYGY